MNLATCPHCKNAYSQTAATCHLCKQTMESGNLSEFNAVKLVNHSKPVNTLVHTLAAGSGIIGFIVANSLRILLLVIFLPFGFNIGYFGSQLIFGLILFATFLVLGALFGFVWDKGGWKLGVSLGSLVAIVWILMFLLDVFSGNFSFDVVVGVITHTFPVLAGGYVGAYFGANYKQKQHTNDGVV